MFGSLLCFVGGALVIDLILGSCNKSSDTKCDIKNNTNKYSNYTTSELDIKFRENGYSEYISNSREYKVNKANELWGGR